jgi:DNA-binding PadR family transcriptional regulator
MPTRTIPATLTATEAAVLALLAIEGEASGYDLLKQVRRSIGFVWAPAKTQLYAVLPRLVRDGLALERGVKGKGKPDKRLYRVSAAGRAALQQWLDTPDDEPSRDTFFLRLFVGGLADREALLDHVASYRALVEDRLAALRAIEPSNTGEGHDAFHRLLLELGLEQYELELRWADRVAKQLRQ